MSMDSIVGSENGANTTRSPHKSRDIFGVQLEVTSLLLDAELAKLATLQSELNTTETQEQVELIVAISKIQSQVEQLEREYKGHALGALRNAPLRACGKSNRSQPAIGLKYLPKLRPSIFGTLASSPAGIVANAGEGSGGDKDDVTFSDDRNGSRECRLSIVSECESISSMSSATSSSSTNTNSSISDSIQPIVKMEDVGLVYKERNLISGTLNCLIEHLIPTASYYPERSYVFAFILSSRLYIRPHELLSKIFHNTLSSKNKINIKDEKVVVNVIQLLNEWAELFPYDFRDERMMGHLKLITQKSLHLYSQSIRQEVSGLLTILLNRLTILERYEDLLQRINTEASLGDPLTSASILTICSNSTVLAQQLTHIELERLSHIGPEEFVQAFAKDNGGGGLETKYKDLKKTRNLESYVQWFNRLSYFVATEICKISKKKNRVRLIEFWIDTAKECFNIGNFNSLMAIIAGLNLSPVSRLKKTWGKVSSTQLSILEHQMDPSSNFSSYRSSLKAAMWRSSGNSDERVQIVIPFFTLLVKDLYFLNEACSSKLKNGHINMEKFWQFAKQVSEVMSWQQVSCPYPKSNTIIHSLQTAPVFNEKALSLSSYECEPAENSQEKERLNYIKGNSKVKVTASKSSPILQST